MSMFLVPAAIKMGSGLLKTFCRQVGCEGPYLLPSYSPPPGGGNPDDNFDVSSRLIELEELDVTKQGWKDLYGRTGIKKGYNGLFLEKVVTEAYSKLAATTSEADYNLAAQQFGLVLDRAQKEAKHSFEDTYYASADIAVLSEGFVDNAAELLLKRLKEPIREVKETFVPSSLLPTQPVLVLPSGSLAGYENSTLLKSTLDEYVKNGGTLVVFAQAHGYDYANLPTPDGTPITAYGWDEDQNCFSDAVAIETWHQMLSGQNRATPTINVDGYFMGYPQNSTVLLKRTANGQPAVIMYDHGKGRVIATSMYSDWAYGHGQASAEEIALVRDMLAWAKKPVLLPENKAGEMANVQLAVTNTTATDAVQVKAIVLNPDRSSTIFEQTLSQPLDAGQSGIVNMVIATDSSWLLGIHHVDYLLLDSKGNVIQPQAETDSGRFAVISPPSIQAPEPGIRFSITSPTQQVFFNEPFIYTFHVFNDTATARNLTIKTWLPHTNRRHEWTVTANPNSEAQITGSDLFLDTYWMFETLRAYLYDENGTQIGSYMLSFKGLYPSVQVTTTLDKTQHAKGDTVAMTVNLRNIQGAAATTNLDVRVTDPANGLMYGAMQPVSLGPNSNETRTITFPIPATAQGGTYTVSSEVFDPSATKIGGDSASFELSLSQVSVTPALPPVLAAGSNTITMNLANSGKVAVNSGILDVTLKDPDGVILTTASFPFSLAVAQNRSIDFPVNFPVLKFGVYTLSYTENDETKSGKPATFPISNSNLTVATFDKPSYRVRETANLAVNISNSGRFNQENVAVTIAVPDAGYSDTKSLNIAQGQALPLQYAVPLPDIMTAGKHAATVTLTLPGGSSATSNFTLSIPQPSLTLTLNQTAYIAGSIITPVIANNGGVDTQAQYRISLYDAKSALIADKSLTETVFANGTFTMNLPVPVGAMDGGYTLVMAYSDLKTSKSELVQRNLTITGIKTALAVQTDRQTYLTTEGITALSNIINSGTALQGGNLHLQVSTAVGSQKQKTWTNQFDFQQGVRDGVDTYGVNDWIIPDDDFSAATLDLNKWSTWGSVSIQGGKLFVDSTSTGSGLNSKWYLDGDFDIQVDFESNNSCGSEGAEFVVTDGIFWFYTKNTSSGPEAGVTINGGWAGWTAIGGHQSSGKMRIVKNSTTIIAFYWNGSGWSELLRSSNSQYGGKPYVVTHVWRGSGCAATSKFDNLTINSGRILKQNETVDSARLLQFSDNFDDGVTNTDRWSVRSSGNVNTNEINGSLVTKDAQAGAQSYSNVAGRFPLEGDFDISVDWKTPVAPASGDWGAIFQIKEFDQNAVSDNNLVGNALQIKRAYINGHGHIYQTGHYNGNSWDSWSSPVTTTDTSGKFRIKKIGSIVTVWYWNSTLNRWEWNGDTAGYTWSSVWTTPSYVQIGISNNLPDMPAAETDWNNFRIISGAAYISKGTIRLKQDAGQPSNWQTITWNSTEPIGTSVKFRTRTGESEGNLSNAPWSGYVTSGSPITSPKGRWIELEATLATTNISVTPLLNDVTVIYGSSQGDILWQADVPLNLAQEAVSDFNNSVGTLGNAGKYYLQGAVTSTTGQTVATYEYPFFVAHGNTALSISPDKRAYKPGETVTISGEVKNFATVEAANLSLLLKGKPSGGVEQTLDTKTFTIPAGGSHPFTVITTAGAEGTVTLYSTVTQNGSILAEIADQYEVAAPKLTATYTAPDTAGNDPFTISLQLTNSGKTDATVMVGKSFSTTPETVMVPAGRTQLLQYPQQISVDTAYSFTLDGDLSQTITKTIKYGLGGSISLTPQALYPKGKVAIPAAIINSGLLDGQFGVSYQLTQADNVLNQQAASYYIAKGGNAADTLNYDLTEGAYQLIATGQLPALASTTTFVVRKEIKADLTQTIGAQNGTNLPVTVNVTNIGFNAISGIVRLSLIDAQGSAVWSAAQDVNLPQSQSPAPQSLAFTINLAAVKPGDYTVKAELLDPGNLQLAAQAAPFPLLAPIFALSQVPPYQTFQAGGNGTFSFKIKNNGNREGACTLALKAADLTDASRTEWLKPGEERDIAFTVTLPADLEEKDYTAAYRLTGNGITVAEDVLRFGVTGIKLSVTAALDRQQYRPGESATLILTISQPVGAASQELFARVHYNDFDGKQDFLLSGSQTLTFAVPLTAITGEKFFYGIYHQSGRSIHLNTIYIYPANDMLAVITDKQVYSPGETVTATITGSAAGTLLLSGPGDFSDTLTFGGTAARNIPLLPDLTAGTFKITATVTTATGEKVMAEHPIDVAGLKITIKEARLDKVVYAATDIMRLTVTVESNRDLPATLRSWVVDPTGTYTPAGESAISLTAASPTLLTLNSSLLTGSMGIHKLVYGIYRGNDLIVSGAKAFDIGNALVNSVATDKKEYPTISEAVSVKTELFGTATGDLAIQLDGTTIQTTSVSLSGFSTQTSLLPANSVTPGRHTIKALLASDGLTSARETEFIFGTSLPDLAARLTVQPPKGQEALITVNVANQGKSTAGPSSLALYDGDPASGGTVIAVLPAPALDANGSATVTFNWNILGKAGEHLIYAVADSGSTVSEFDERNNTAKTPITLPDFSFFVTTGKKAYAANEEAAFSVALANLSATSAYLDAAVELKLTDPAGMVKNLLVKALPLQPAYAANFITSWNTGSNMPGEYTLRGRLLSGTTELAAQDAGFTIQPTVAITGSFTLSKDEVILGTPLGIATTVINNGNADVTRGEILVEIVDKATGMTVQSLAQTFERLVVQAKAEQTILLSKVEVQPGDYLLRVTAVSAGQRFGWGEKPLRVLPPLEVTHGFDLSPRVLVLVGRTGNAAGDPDPVEQQIRRALNGYAASFTIIGEVDAFRREMRSGMYNTYILAGARPLVDHLESELGERVNSGEGLILFGYDKIEDVKLRDITNLKAEGRLPAGVRPMTLLPGPMTHAGSDQVDGTPLKLRLISTTVQVAAIVADKGNAWPMIVLNPYGAGKVVVFASDLSGNLLRSALTYVASAQGDSIPGAPLNAAITLKSLGALFDLRVKENVPVSLPILSISPLGSLDQHLISWPVNVAKDGTAMLAYSVALPETGGSYEASTEVAFVRNGSLETYKSISHLLGAGRSLADIRNEILFRLRNMPAVGKDVNELREALRRYENFLVMPDYSAPQLDRAIRQLLEVVEELREMTMDTTAVRLELDRLLKAYGRKWVDTGK
ncbi:MAG TPA: CARDB domain-containing protein [Desulfuromonadaceae bacterium]